LRFRRYEGGGRRRREEGERRKELINNKIIKWISKALAGWH
jgi:hypothetical protein